MFYQPLPSTSQAPVQPLFSAYSAPAHPQTQPIPSQYPIRSQHLPSPCQHLVSFYFRAFQSIEELVIAE